MQIDSELDRLLLSNNPDALVLARMDGTIAHWSRGAETLLGYTAEEALGQPLASLIVPAAQRERDRQLLARARTHGGAAYESLRQRRDGALLHVDVTVRGIESADPAARFDLYSMKDITRLKVGRDAQMVAARYGKLLESLPDGIVLVGPSGLIVLATRQAEQLFGYGAGELAGQPIEVLLPAAVRGAHLKHRSDFFSQPRLRSMGAGLDLRGLRKDGSEFPVEISLSPIDLDEGTLVMSAIRDISERGKADRKFRGLLEAAPDAMVIVDQQGTVVLINSQTEKLFGYTRQQLLGQSVEILVPPRFRGSHSSHRGAFFAQPHARAMGAGLDLYGLRCDGSEFPVEISLSPLETSEGVLVTSAIRDISERKRIERKLSEQNIELQRAAEAKDRFLAGMSHELRTPLNAIIGFTGTLLMRLPGPLNAVQQRQLSTVQQNGRHLLSLINDILDLAKIQSGKVELKSERVSCADLIDAVAATLRPAAEEKGLKFQVDLPATDLVLSTDRRALNQIVINLVNNAIKFTPKGGSVLLAVMPENGGRLRIEVRDTGCGIRLEDQPRLFEAFNRMDSDPALPPQPGTGLGLHLSRQLARLIGGEISFSSEFGQGSCFVLTLPLV